MRQVLGRESTDAMLGGEGEEFFEGEKRGGKGSRWVSERRGQGMEGKYHRGKREGGEGGVGRGRRRRFGQERSRCRRDCAVFSCGIDVGIIAICIHTDFVARFVADVVSDVIACDLAVVFARDSANVDSHFFVNFIQNHVCGIHEPIIITIFVITGVTLPIHLIFSRRRRRRRRQKGGTKGRRTNTMLFSLLLLLLLLLLLFVIIIRGISRKITVHPHHIPQSLFYFLYKFLYDPHSPCSPFPASFQSYFFVSLAHLKTEPSKLLVVANCHRPQNRHQRFWREVVQQQRLPLLPPGAAVSGAVPGLGGEQKEPHSLENRAVRADPEDAVRAGERMDDILEVGAVDYDPLVAGEFGGGVGAVVSGG